MRPRYSLLAAAQGAYPDGHTNTACTGALLLDERLP